jgi:hypothetical protein
MACRSVHAAIVGRDKQRRNLFFTERQAFGFLINGPLKVIEQTGHRGGQARKPDRIGRTAGRHVPRAAVQLPNRFIDGILLFGCNPCRPRHQRFPLFYYFLTFRRERAGKRIPGHSGSGPQFEALLIYLGAPLCATLLVNQPKAEFLVKVPCGTETFKGP